MEIYEDLGGVASLLTPEVIWLNIVLLTAAAFATLLAMAVAGSVLFTFKLSSVPARWVDARLSALEARLPAEMPQGGEDCRTGLGLARAAPAVLNALLSRTAPAPDTTQAASPARQAAEPHLVPLPAETRLAVKAATRPR